MTRPAQRAQTGNANLRNAKLRNANLHNANLRNAMAGDAPGPSTSPRSAGPLRRGGSIPWAAGSAYSNLRSLSRSNGLALMETWREAMARVTSSRP
jgi:uncharacterized protein YjbI with pentapeptide repeats